MDLRKRVGASRENANSAGKSGFHALLLQHPFSIMQPSLFARSVRNTFLKRRPVFRSVSTTSRLLKDPWPLPHTPEHLASTVTPTDLPPPEPLSRSNESIETTRARLIYQSRKRGTLESDLLLSTFAQEKLSAMDASELHEYDKVRACVFCFLCNPIYLICFHGFSSCPSLVCQLLTKTSNP